MPNVVFFSFSLSISNRNTSKYGNMGAPDFMNIIFVTAHSVVHGLGPALSSVCSVPIVFVTVYFVGN